MAVWALIGFMGCGKSSIGRTVQRLAAASPVENIDFPIVDTNSRPTVSGTPISPIVDTNSSPTVSGELIFVDLDEEIVRREGRSIREIFAEGGEAAFRAIERETLGELLAEAGNLLISLGGGTLTDPESRELVRKHCRCIYLRASLETLAANLRQDDVAGRPMLSGVNAEAAAEAPDSLESRIASMMAARGPVYEKAADIILDIDGLDYEDAARQIINSFSL